MLIEYEAALRDYWRAVDCRAAQLLRDGVEPTEARERAAAEELAARRRTAATLAGDKRGSR